MTRLLLSNFKSWTIEQRWLKYAKIQAKLLAVTNRQPVKGFNSTKHFMEPASRKSTVYCRWRVAWEPGSDLRCKNMVIVTILHTVTWNWYWSLVSLFQQFQNFVLFLWDADVAGGVYHVLICLKYLPIAKFVKIKKLMVFLKIKSSFFWCKNP